MKKSRIIATGVYLPEKVLTNADLEKMVDTSDEWIVSRTGMKERRIARDDEYTSDMGAAAAERCLESIDMPKDKVDCIITATLTPDYIFPSTACVIQNKLKIKGVACFDIQAACTGFIYALSIAKAYVDSGTYKNVLVVTSEKLSSIVDYTDRSTCVLFGDGASAVLVSAEGDGLEVTSVCLGADGEQADLLYMPGGGCRNPASRETVDKGLHYLKMSGNEVFKHAVRRMESAAKECLAIAKIEEKDVSWVVPHQANVRIIDAIARRFEHLSSDRIYKTVHKYGNTSCSSIGLALDELMKKGNVSNNEHLLLTAFGSGFTWGASILTYRKGNDS